MKSALAPHPHETLRALVGDLTDEQRADLVTRGPRNQSDKLSTRAEQQKLASEICWHFELAKQSADAKTKAFHFDAAEKCRQQLGIPWSRWAQGGVR